MRWKTPVALVAILAFVAMQDLCVAEVCLATSASVLSHAPVCPSPLAAEGELPVCSGRTCPTATLLLLLFVL
jgi:hypothetical protein